MSEAILKKYSQVISERKPTIVAELPSTGSENILYLVPTGQDNYSMHIWMEIEGVYKWVNIKSGNENASSIYDSYRIIELDQADYVVIDTFYTNSSTKLLLSVLDNKVIGFYFYAMSQKDLTFSSSNNINIVTNINFAKYNVTLSGGLRYSPFKVYIEGTVKVYEFWPTMNYNGDGENDARSLCLSRLIFNNTNETIQAGKYVYIYRGTFL